MVTQLAQARAHCVGRVDIGWRICLGLRQPLSRQGSYTTLDAGIRFDAEGDNWHIAVIGKNLTNEFYVTGVVDGPGTGSGTGTAGGLRADQLGFGTCTLPRTVRAELTKRF